MAFQPASGVWEIAVDQQYLGLPVAHVFHVKPGGGLPAPSMEAVALEILSWYATEYAAMVHIGWSVLQIRIRDLTSENGSTFVQPGNGAAVGTLQGDPLPGSVALCVKKSTGVAGKTARGRIYTCGHVATQLKATNGNQFDTTVCDNAVQAFNSLRTSLATMNAPLQVLSRWSNKVLRPTGFVRPVTNFVCVDEQVDSQRGRAKA